MRRIAIAALALALASSGAAHGQERREPDLLLRRPGGGYETPRLPAGRYDVGRDTGSRYQGVYDRQGRRVGTVERTPYGGSVFRDNQDRRR